MIKNNKHKDIVNEIEQTRSKLRSLMIDAEQYFDYRVGVKVKNKLGRYPTHGKHLIITGVKLSEEGDELLVMDVAKLKPDGTASNTVIRNQPTEKWEIVYE